MQKGPVVIEGKIENFETRFVRLSFQDLVGGSTNYAQAIDTATGYFKFIFDIYHGQDILFEHNNGYLQLFIEPSDSLFLSFDAREFNRNNYDINFRGRNARINEDIQKFRAFKQVPAFNPDISGKSIRQYHTELEQQVTMELDELSRFAEKFSPSEKFVQWARYDIIYNNANYLIDYKAHLHYNNLPANDSIFLTGLFPVTDKNALISSLFGLHLWHYAADRYIQSNPEVLSLYNEGNYFDAYKIGLDNIINGEKEGLLRDIMVFKLIGSLLQESSSDFEELFNSYQGILENQLLVADLEKRLKQSGQISLHEIAYIDHKNTLRDETISDLMGLLIEKSREKTLYLDFWAVWCGPCRSEFPWLLELHDKISGRNIDIVSICFSSDRNTWISFVKDNNLPGKHYHLNKEQSDLLRSRLQIRGFPTYMIMKDGEIINTDASRPSSGEKIFNELIRVSSL